ncbi:MAG: transcriptional repressor LexA [Oscillospiraceae bacterium]|nr:transcriptional repressor LexA [Ruminococcus sp.]MBQ4346001.1 transcriptional repressor LexA [Oscillospiraceae bacterium]
MLNDTARAVYSYICQRIDEGYPPTIREICSALGIRSTSTVHRYINRLAEEGYLEKMDNQNRAIRLKGRSSVNVPLIGTVTAGLPITAIENITEYLPYVPHRHFSGELFALKVRGESMINAGIFDGDVVIVERQQVAENGDIIVALVNEEEATVKRFYKENGGYRLQPENDTMEPIFVDEVAVLGKVVALLRYFEQ